MWVVDKVSGHRVKTRVVEVMPIQLKRLSKSDFRFDWLKVDCDEIYQLVISADGYILGMMALKVIAEELRIEICLLEVSASNVGKGKEFENIAGILLAHACKLSFKYGFFGFISLIPKTALVSHYKKKYGFVSYGTHLGMDLERSEKLINKYLAKDKS